MEGREGKGRVRLVSCSTLHLVCRCIVIGKFYGVRLSVCAASFRVHEK